MGWWTLSFVVLGCAHQEAPAELTGPTLELRLDDGKPDEKLTLPERAQEILMRFDPGLAGYVPLTVKLLLAAPGPTALSVYRTSPEGNPGVLVQRIGRNYGSDFVSGGKDGRWVVERLSVPEQHSPLWVGLSGASAVWASAHDSSWVFQRSRASSIYTGRLTKTPLVRVEVAPTRR
jgi:hypothetical protein